MKKRQKEAGKAGRPKALDPKSDRHLIRCTPEQSADIAADIQRLTRVTGANWTVSSYARMCMAEMHGKHLAGAQ